MATYTSSGKEVKRDGVRFCDAVSEENAAMIRLAMINMGGTDGNHPKRRKLLTVTDNRQEIVPAPLTDREVNELDGYGNINGRMSLSARCIELWEREIYWGRVTPPANSRGLLELLED
jgi:hypothetical protein